MFQRQKNKIRSINFDQAMMVALSSTPLLEDIAEWNRRQMYAGKDSAGVKMVPPYTASTKKQKRKKGQPINRVTLKDTGAFYASLMADATPQGLIVGSDHLVKGFDLASFLDGRYGHPASIYGIAPQYYKRLLKRSIPMFSRNVLKQVV